MFKLNTLVLLGVLAVIALVVILTIVFINRSKSKKAQHNNSTVYCTNCGAKIPSNSSFCTGCGKKLS